MESTPPTFPRSNGRLVDWSTQLWVRMTGQTVRWSDHPWLEGPVGDADIIGTDFFRRYAERRAWTATSDGAPRGLVDDFNSIGGPTFDPSRVAPQVVVESSPGHGWARYVRAMRESIHAYLDADNELRADHDLQFLGHRFLRLHYRMRERAAG
jgi:hypothetical protein